MERRGLFCVKHEEIMIKSADEMDKQPSYDTYTYIYYHDADEDEDEDVISRMIEHANKHELSGQLQLTCIENNENSLKYRSFVIDLPESRK